MELCFYGKYIQNFTLGRPEHFYIASPATSPVPSQGGRVWGWGSNEDSYITYLLLHNKLSHNLSAQNNKHFSHTASEGRESGSNLARWLQLLISWSGIRDVSWAVIILRIHWGWATHSQVGSLSGYLLEGLSPPLATGRNQQFLVIRFCPRGSLRFLWHS